MLKMKNIIFRQSCVFKHIIIYRFQNLSNSTISSLAKKKDYKEPVTAVGEYLFKELVEKSTVFVDKSLVIKEFLKDSAKVSLVTCPRRWGKSINMDMIKTFCEIEVDKYGVKYADKKHTTNYKLFKGELKSNELEKPLNIATCEDLMNDYQGEYPVIYVDFKDIRATDYQTILNKVKGAINKSFKEHEYIIDVFKGILSDSDSRSLMKQKAEGYLNKFNRLYNNDAQDATEFDIQDSLVFLSEVLNTHFGKKAFILVDEYDAPINRILQDKEFSGHDLKKTLDLFRGIMGSTFKGNKYLEKGLITGVLRIAKSSLFSDLNNIVEYSIMDNKYARYYGFTQDEVKLLLNEYKIPEKDQLTAQMWYNGYRILKDPTLEIYNPWSIVNYLEKKEIANYWTQSGNIDFIRELFKIKIIKDKIESLLYDKVTDDQNTKPVLVKLIDLKFSKEDFLTLRDLIDKGDNYEFNNNTLDLFLRYIFAAGYLTVAKGQRYSTASRISVKIPNIEVKLELEEKLLLYYEKIYNIGTEYFQRVTDELVKIMDNEDTNGLRKSLEELLEHYPDFIDIKENTKTVGVHGNDALIHSIINYTSSQINILSKFGAEVRFGNLARPDIILIVENSLTALIIELKYDGSAEKALDQTKKYVPLLSKYSNIQFIKCLGINVSRDKRVTIASRIDKNHSNAG